MRGLCHDFREYPKYDEAGNILVFHFSIGSQFLSLLRELECRKIIKYHNITPAKFFLGIDRQAAERLEQGREELKHFTQIVDLALGDSEYNRLELEKAGYKNTGVVPILLKLSSLECEPDLKVLRTNAAAFTNVLFVGRVVPNKKSEDIIRCFYYYQKTINPGSRLFFVGSYQGMQNYYSYLKGIVSELGLTNVVFSGHVSQAELAAYYRLADLFLCMSEHEGFCIPLLEAMHCDIPVIAYRAAAVGETLNGAGILVNRKRFEEIAEMMDLLMKDKALRQQVIADQKKRLADFSPEKTEKKLREYLGEWII